MPKEIYVTDRYYKTAGRAKTHLQLKKKPAYRVEIDAEKAKLTKPMKKVDTIEHPEWGKGGGRQSTVRKPIPVKPNSIKRLKGAE